MRSFPLIAGMASLAFGLVLVLWFEPSFSSEMRIAGSSSMWPATTGSLLGIRNLATVGSPSPSRLAVVTFAYDVSGRKYSDSQILCDCESIFTSEDVLRNFSRGTPVSVFYDPVSPSLSVIQPRGVDAAFLAKWGLETAAVLLFFAVIPIALWTLR